MVAQSIIGANNDKLNKYFIILVLNVIELMTVFNNWIIITLTVTKILTTSISIRKNKIE